MSKIDGKKIIISGLVSSKLNLYEYLPSIRRSILRQGGEIIGELIQRRGVSRSKRPGGSKALELQLNQRTCMTTGKIKELKKISHNLNADIVIIINNMTESQMRNIENLIEIKVEKMIT